MEKRYQIFVSSTFMDLKDERQAVLRAVLELDQMPAGMELFPAADDSAWQLIRDVIDASDYYLVIVGGRYGSPDERGVGYTEKEYDYATESAKPVLALLHEKPDTLPREKTETDDAAWKKLQKFREKVEKRHHCVYWKSAEDLKSKVIVGLMAAMKRTPGVGWVRADKIPSEATLADVLALRKRLAELEHQLANDASRPPKGTEDLVQDNESFKVEFSFVARVPDDPYPFEKDKPWDAWVEPTWNEMFAAVAPAMINEAVDSEVKNALQRFFIARAKEEFGQDRDLKRRQMVDFKFKSGQFETVILQFRALGLIEASVKPRSVRDTRTYWRLTKHGDNLMTKLRAIRRTTPPEVTGGLIPGEDERLATEPITSEFG